MSNENMLTSTEKKVRSHALELYSNIRSNYYKQAAKIDASYRSLLSRVKSGTKRMADALKSVEGTMAFSEQDTKKAAALLHSPVQTTQQVTESVTGACSY